LGSSIFSKSSKVNSFFGFVGKRKLEEMNRVRAVVEKNTNGVVVNN